MKSWIFHLAIPCADLDTSIDYYTRLGCRVARRYQDRITIDFFEHQVVCHLDPSKVDRHPEMYPRHFGITFCDKKHFDSVHDRAVEFQLPFFSKLNRRFTGKREEHETFFLIDPSNNLLEFKYYKDLEMIY